MQRRTPPARDVQTLAHVLPMRTHCLAAAASGVLDKGVPHGRPRRPHARGALRGSSAVLPTRADHRALHDATAALDAGVVVRRRWREHRAAVRSASRFVLSAPVLHADETP